MKEQNLYSFLYSIQMTLEGDRHVKGHNVREAQNNLLRELTQELSIRELVSQSLVMPICPIEDIEIKEPELLQGVEPALDTLPKQ